MYRIQLVHKQNPFHNFLNVRTLMKNGPTWLEPFLQKLMTYNKNMKFITTDWIKIKFYNNFALETSLSLHVVNKKTFEASNYLKIGASKFFLNTKWKV